MLQLKSSKNGFSKNYCEFVLIIKPNFPFFTIVRDMRNFNTYYSFGFFFFYLLMIKERL